MYGNKIALDLLPQNYQNLLSNEYSTIILLRIIITDIVLLYYIITIVNSNGQSQTPHSSAIGMI